MFRKSGLDDCRAVYDLICGMEGRELPRQSFWGIYSDQVEDPRYYCLLWEGSGGVDAALNLRFEEQLHHGERIAEILEFAVSPSCRSQGLGGRMLAEGCRIARDRGCSQMEVACNQLRGDAHRFYLREGMHNFHYKFSKRLLEGDSGENSLGR